MPNNPGFSQEAWKRLCTYIHHEILCYPPEAKFPRSLALKLRGLSRGQFVANNKAPKQAEYSYDVLYYTAVSVKQKLLQYFAQNKTRINGEEHRINLLLRFLEGEVNNVYLRLQANEQAQQKLSALNLEHQTHEAAPYTTKGKVVKGLDELW